LVKNNNNKMKRPGTYPIEKMTYFILQFTNKFIVG